MQAVFLLSSEEKVEFFKGTLIHKVEVHICFFFSQISKSILTLWMLEILM